MDRTLIFWIRAMVPILITASMGTLIYFLHAFKKMSFNLNVMIVATVLVYAIFEMNRWIGQYLFQRNPQTKGIWIRFFLPFILSFLAAEGLIFLFYIPFKLYQIAQGANDTLHPIYLLTVSLQVFFLVLPANAINQILVLIQKWQEESLRVEQLEKEKVQAVLSSLKHQISPHFLFNNFNTLYGLIEEDAKLAGEYLLKLSTLYRNMLQNQEEVVAIREELKAFQDYLFLLKIRFAEDIQIVDELFFLEEEHFFIPPLTLQTLLENAVKHNHFNQTHPLKIWLKRNGGRIEFSNAFFPLEKPRMTSIGIGLENICTRYELLSDEAVEITQTDKLFFVSLPLLRLENSSYESGNH
ncbi:MAG: histidine kinase [Saprospiraceae bacterium]